jgi:hypothetical protein
MSKCIPSAVVHTSHPENTIIDTRRSCCLGMTETSCWTFPFGSRSCREFITRTAYVLVWWINKGHNNWSRVNGEAIVLDSSLVHQKCNRIISYVGRSLVPHETSICFHLQSVDQKRVSESILHNIRNLLLRKKESPIILPALIAPCTGTTSRTAWRLFWGPVLF